MSYQVLARKWRPRSFGEMAGQEHVLKALINALDQKRLHHAYLFTGTRGVGKTTVARILAKCLNCETGIGSTPCGVCSACTEISEGRFVDLIEVDAASRTKVEDTRELLDNVQYSPTSGRFKIYLIDEVHMLSNSSFNALLKTLEEPPEHVKFLLATTDPQKLPATILSRCLQFNLKNLSPEKIVHHLNKILQEEAVPFEDSALWQLARSADGSMRDALSLTDQAIAFGNGKLSEIDVTSMLGTIDHKFIQDLLDALINGDGKKLLQAVAAFAEHAPDYSSALADFQTLLHRVAIAQALPDALDNSYGDRQQIIKFASRIAPEDVQLFYQTALMGQRDLNLSPVARTAFEMVLLRMLAFKPQGVVDIPKQSLARTSPSETTVSDRLTSSPQSKPDDSVSENTASQSIEDTSAEMVVSKERSAEKKSLAAHPKPEKRESELIREVDVPELSEDKNERISQLKDAVSFPASVNPEPSVTVKSAAASPIVAPSVLVPTSPSSAPTPRLTPTLTQSTVAAVETSERSEPRTGEEESISEKSHNVENEALIRLDEFAPDRWLALFGQLEISGILKLTASNLVCVGKEENQLYFIQDDTSGALLNNEHALRLGDTLSDYFRLPVKVHIQVGAIESSKETPSRYRLRITQEKKQMALEKFKRDPVIQNLQKQFGAVVVDDSIELREEKS